MSSKEQFISAKGDALPHNDNPNPDCPKCNSPMMLRQVSPVMFASNLDDVVYGCERCGAEAKHTVKRA